MTLTLSAIREQVQAALSEDCALSAKGELHDATSLAVVPESARATGRIVARASGVLSGCAFAEAAFRLCDADVELTWLKTDGDAVAPDEDVLHCAGTARGLLAAERTALNFMQQLGGVATLTAQAVAAAGEVLVLDTRKTVPGLRDAQKAAVVHGGGVNHRRDLHDQLLLKENHFSLSSLDYAATVARAVTEAAGRKVGIEAETIEQAEWALQAGADYVMLDNFHGHILVDAVAHLRAQFPDAVLEASGGYTVETVAKLVGSGVARVSLGAFTHSAPALDLSFYLTPVVPGGTTPLHA